MSNAYVLQLRTELKNPAPDRRSKDWHKAAVIPAGTRFIVQNDVTIMAVSQRYAWIAIASDLGKSIVANSEHVEPSALREIKVVDADHDYDGDGILEALLKMNRITRKDFRDARDFMNAEYEVEEARRTEDTEAMAVEAADKIARRQSESQTEKADKWSPEGFDAEDAERRR